MNGYWNQPSSPCVELLEQTTHQLHAHVLNTEMRRSERYIMMQAIRRQDNNHTRRDLVLSISVLGEEGTTVTKHDEEL